MRAVEEFDDDRLAELGRFLLRAEAGFHDDAEGARGAADPRLVPLHTFARSIVERFLRHEEEATRI